jgi:hypothetical protein
MSDELDPEVLADLRLREATLRDPTRTKRDQAVRWDPPEVVTTWPCRNKACQWPVDVTQSAIDSFNLFNAILVKRGEPALSTTEIVVCDECRKKLEQHKAGLNYERRDEMRELIRRLKASKDPRKDPRKETELLALLEKRRHPDIPGLLESLSTAKARKRAPRPEDVSGE